MMLFDDNTDHDRTNTVLDDLLGDDSSAQIAKPSPILLTEAKRLVLVFIRSRTIA